MLSPTSITSLILSESQSDDTHVCNSCKEPGWLICCEGCERAFHSHCLDPPLTMGNSMLEDAYYCHVCLARRQPPKKQPRGLFASLLQTLEKRNPVVFSLPEQLKCYFRDVATGKDGNFEDPANLKTRYVLNHLSKRSIFTDIVS